MQGTGGVGKTQLAATFTKAHRDAFSALFWLNGQTEDTLKQSYIKAANRIYNECPSSEILGPALNSMDTTRITDAMKRWLSLKHNTKWILVFDNVDNPKLPDTDNPQAYNIKPYFPEAHQGFILITTRSSRLNIDKVISVKKLTELRDSIAILTSMSKRQISDQGMYSH